MRAVRFFIDAYRDHWLATPIAALAAILSTTLAAITMSIVALISYQAFTKGQAILLHAILGPLTAYVFYLAIYYGGMFIKEKRSLLTDGHLDKAKLRNWFRVVKYDYIAHLPSDCYLITLAAIMQAGLESTGMHVFFAVLVSQFVDDFITFLKEPALWGGAKAIVAWEGKRGKSLTGSAILE